jgi:hypothetical protein
MRKCDRDEVYASHGHTPLQALEQGFKEGEECWTVLLEKEPIAMFGISKMKFHELGGVWFLGTNKVYLAKKAFYTEAPKFLERWQREYPALFNIVDLRNEASIHWMVQMGFEVADIKIYATHEKRPFALMMRYQ